MRGGGGGGGGGGAAGGGGGGGGGAALGAAAAAANCHLETTAADGGRSRCCSHLRWSEKLASCICMSRSSSASPLRRSSLSASSAAASFCS